ncbi:MAG: hypothetical protein AB7L66_15145 [Gemmatimonadales bacterium]
MSRVRFLMVAVLLCPSALAAQPSFRAEAGVLALSISPRDGGGDQLGLALFAGKRVGRHWRVEADAAAIPTGGLLAFKGIALEMGTAWHAEVDDFAFEGTAGVAGLAGRDRIGTLTRLGLFGGTTVTWWVARRIGLRSNVRQRFWSGGVGGGSAGIGIAVRW